MTWSKQVEMPEPIANARDVRERACGPAGCLVAGWMRVGWGAPSASGSPKELPMPPAPPSRDMPPLDLFCQPTGGPAPIPAAHVPTARRAEPMAQGFALPHPWMVGSSQALTCASELAPFQGHPAPVMSAEECGLQLDASAGLDRPVFPMGLAHVYAWGSKSGDWDAAGKWKIAWLWPWGGWPDARASVIVPAPWTTRDTAGRFLGLPSGTTTRWTLMPADDPDHALLLARRAAATRSVEVWSLESERAPIEVHGPSGDSFGDVQGATRVAGRWYLATTQSGAELPATVVWALDGGAAREIARLPRVDGEAPAASYLGHRTDGGAIGLVVQGQAGLDRGTPPRWVVAIDLESGAMSDPEPLARVDRTGGAVVCTGDDDGWVIDLPYTGTVRVHAGPTWSATLAGPPPRASGSPIQEPVSNVLRERCSAIPTRRPH